MKATRYTVAMLAMAFVLTFAGCNKKPAPTATNLMTEQPELTACLTSDNELAPSWYCTPGAKGMFAVSVGEAKANATKDRSMQRSTAVAKARAALSQDIEVKVSTMITDWTRVTGQGENQTYEANVENVSKQIASQTLQGSKIIDTWYSKDGTLAVLVGIEANPSTKDIIKTSLQNDQALWQQFQSQKALDKLDAEFEKQ